MANGKVIALGYFDGVHMGHGALLRKARSMADDMGLTAAAVTFDIHPTQLLTGQQVPLLTSRETRQALMKSLYGIDEVLTLHFDETMKNMPWDDFGRMLLETYGAKALVCGHDFRCGRRGEGSAEKLKGFCIQNGMGFAVIDKVELDGRTVSSTLIRQFVEAGDMEQAARFLGHPHVLTGVVEKGHQLGRTIGIPTANVAFADDLVVPAAGVYAAKVRIDESEYLAVTNVGTHPTVNQRTCPWAEPWILDFDGDLYGTNIEILFFKRLRDEKKFPSLEALADEIRRNADQTREYFAK